MSTWTSPSRGVLCCDNIVMYILLVTMVCIGAVATQGCLSTQTDPGATKLRQLGQSLESAECDLVSSVTYRDHNPECGEEYDFIVVGAGTAGSVVASSLSENPAWRVLLLEAGGDPVITTEFPSLRETLIGSPLDWNYTAEPNGRSCLSSVNQRCYWPMGKALGGTSTINGMIYNRGYPEVFNSWEREGNIGWGYNSLLSYFKKSEDLEADIVKKIVNYKYYHGECGYLTVESFYQTCDLDVFVQNVSSAFKELGYETFPDINAQFHEGLFHIQGTMRDGRRCSTAKAFLKPAQVRKNLKISKYSLVTRILINKNKTACGVIFEKCGTSITVRARKEVIISASVVRSPQLLMLSGIGPRDHLEQLGIQVISNLPVGLNLQDQYAVNGVVTSLEVNISLPVADESFNGVLFQSKGTYDTNGNILEAYITTSNAEYPNILFIPTVTPVNSTDSLVDINRRYGFDDAYIQSLIKINSKRSLFSFYPILVQPKSAGRIMLKSRNPREYPLIYPNYLAEEEDVEDLLEGIEFVNRLINTDAMKKLGARMERLDIPGCRSFRFQSVDYWKCIIRYTGSSDYHAIGSCRMGPPEAPGSVVNPDLQVIGVSGLRVVDGSIMPKVANGNTMAPIIAIAEKASDLIKRCWICRE